MELVLGRGAYPWASSQTLFHSWDSIAENIMSLRTNSAMDGPPPPHDGKSACGTSSVPKITSARSIVRQQNGTGMIICCHNDVVM